MVSVHQWCTAEKVFLNFFLTVFLEVFTTSFIPRRILPNRKDYKLTKSLVRVMLMCKFASFQISFKTYSD